MKIFALLSNVFIAVLVVAIIAFIYQPVVSTAKLDTIWLLSLVVSIATAICLITLQIDFNGE